MNHPEDKLTKDAEEEMQTANDDIKRYSISLQFSKYNL